MHVEFHCRAANILIMCSTHLNKPKTTSYALRNAFKGLVQGHALRAFVIVYILLKYNK